MKKGLIVIITTLCLLYPLSAFTGTAQASQPEGAVTPPAGPLSLQNCIDLAMQYNHARAVAQADLAVAESRQGQARSSWWPSLSAGALATRMDEYPVFTFPASTMTIPAGAFAPGFPPMDAELPIEEQRLKLMDRDNLMGHVKLTYPIYTGGLRSAIVKQAKAGVQAARHQQKQTDDEIIRDVTLAYYGTVLGQRLIRVADDTLARMEATLDLTERLYQTGSGTVKKTDYLRNKAMVETVRSATAASRNTERQARAALVMLMGMPWETQVEVSEEEIPFAPHTYTVEELVDRAQAANPQLAQVEAGIIAAKARIREAWSEYIPKVGLTGSWHAIENDYHAGIVDPQNTRMWMVGLGVEIPLFEGFRRKHKVREAKAGLEKLQGQRAQLSDAVALRVKQAFDDVVQAGEQESAAGEGMKSAAENRELNVRAYQEELVETKDVIEAQLMEALLEAQYEKVLFDHVRALEQLEFVIGGPIAQ